ITPCCKSRLRQARTVIPLGRRESRRGRSMMGRLKSDQGLLFYEFHLGDTVPEEDHLVRKIDAVLDLTWLLSELAPCYSLIGRPSIDPELMIRMLVVGYVFAIRSERLICREVQVNLGLSLVLQARYRGGPRTDLLHES